MGSDYNPINVWGCGNRLAQPGIFIRGKLRSRFGQQGDLNCSSTGVSDMGQMKVPQVYEFKTIEISAGERACCAHKMLIPYDTVV
jgi:hypothetical protein